MREYLPKLWLKSKLLFYMVLPSHEVLDEKYNITSPLKYCRTEIKVDLLQLYFKDILQMIIIVGQRQKQICCSYILKTYSLGDKLYFKDCLDDYYLLVVVFIEIIEINCQREHETEMLIHLYIQTGTQFDPGATYVIIHLMCFIVYMFIDLC